MFKVNVKSYDQLSKQELYLILRLRSEVFVVEQNCVYQDIDNKDQSALHLFIPNDNDIIAYTRLFNAGDYFNEASIGRVVVGKEFRDKKIGHIIIEKSIQTIKEKYNRSCIVISAQTYLKNFYASHKFLQTGEGYLEDGIPHIKMKLDLTLD